MTIINLFRKTKKDHWSTVFNPVDTITDILPEDGILLQSTLNEVCLFSFIRHYTLDIQS